MWFDFLMNWLEVIDLAILWNGHDLTFSDLTLSHFLPSLSMAYGISVAEISLTYVYALVPHIEFMD